MKYQSNLFEGVPKHQINKSRFNRSHEWKHDFELGLYIPCLWEPTMPGDEYEIQSEFMFKFDPLYYPVIHKVMFHCDYFWVPNRIMWKEDTEAEDVTGWKAWIRSSSEETHPTLDIDMEHFNTAASNNSIMGYFGIPYLISGAGRSTIITGLNAFVPMAFIHIRDEYYRNPNLEEAAKFNLQSGDNTELFRIVYGKMVDQNGPPNYTLDVIPCKWQKDYLTSALPEPQQGDPVTIPTYGIGEDGRPLPATVRKVTDDTLPLDGNIETLVGVIVDSNTNTGLYIAEDTAPIMRQLRIAEVLQSYRERLMKIGQRYRDYIKGMFGNDPQPLEVDVPVMFGSYRGSVQISEVLTKANTEIGETTFNTGDYAGNASLYEGNNQKLKFYCPEHGIIMAIMSLVPNTGYGQGIERYWRYSLPVDYPLDMFSTVGDQEILKEEAMYNNVTAQAAKNQETFGYIPKYSEARHRNNSYGTNLAFNAGLSMHLGKRYNPTTFIGTFYDNAIQISQAYINAGPVYAGGTRVVDTFKTLTLLSGASAQKSVVGYVYHEIWVNRNLPMFSTPKL